VDEREELLSRRFIGRVGCDRTRCPPCGLCEMRFSDEPCQHRRDGWRFGTRLQLDACAKLDHAMCVELLVSSEGYQQERFAMDESSKGRAESAVGDDRLAGCEQLIVVRVWDGLDIVRDADVFRWHRRSQREDRVHVHTRDGVTDPLDQGDLACHHSGAEAQEHERPFSFRVRVGGQGNAERARVDNL
jgi:hypothetical protein